MKLTLWKNNRLDQKWSITYQEFLKKFKRSSFYNHPKGREMALRLFIMCDLKSGYEEDDFQKLEKWIWNKI